MTSETVYGVVRTSSLYEVVKMLFTETSNVDTVKAFACEKQANDFAEACNTEFKEGHKAQ
jgi:hypothetical protein